MSVQVNVKVPPELADLVRQVAARLRQHPEFPAQLTAMLAQGSQASQPADAALTERVEAIEAELAGLRSEFAATKEALAKASLKARPASARAGTAGSLAPDIIARMRDLKAQGKSNRVIAKELGIASSTVSRHTSPLRHHEATSG